MWASRSLLRTAIDRLYLTKKDALWIKKLNNPETKTAGAQVEGKEFLESRRLAEFLIQAGSTYTTNGESSLVT